MSIYAIRIANILVFLKTVVQEAMKHKTLLILLTLLLTFSSHAGPARQGIIPLIQPDGTIFDAIIRGDEFLRWTTTREGNAIVQEEDGWWCYATFDNEGNRSSSGWRVGETAPAAIMSESKLIPLDRLSAAASRKRRAHSYFMESQPLTKNGVLSQKHVIVILAQFSDVRFEYSRQDFIDMLTKEGYSRNGSIGSAKEYFDGQFKGKTEFSFEVSDIITLPGKRADYGSNLPNGEDKDPTRMIIEACQATDEKIDFTLYDDDNDGEIDNVFIFFAGGDESEGAGDECIWSHSWYVYDGAEQTVMLDGRQLNRYACTSELTRIFYGKHIEETLCGIGSFCHEYGHTLGLVDLYDTDYGGSGGETEALWMSTSLMDGGNHNNNGNTPPYFNAIEREMLGICEPVRITSDGSYSLGPIDQTNTIFRLDTDNEDEYFLLECRSRKGWDAHIGGEGLLVYHIDRSERASGYSEYYERVLTAAERWKNANEVNCRPDHQCADLIEAQCRDVSTIFFPQKDIDSITPESTPDFRFWSGATGGVRISDIRWENGSIRFIVRGISGIPEPPEIIKVEIETFPDAAIIKLESDRISDGNAVIEWGRSADRKETMTVRSYMPGKYAFLLEGLQPDNKTYNVDVCIEESGIKGEIRSFSFMTRKSPSVSWPYIYMTGVRQNADGTIPEGSPLPLRVCNAAGAAEIIWSYNGREISVDSDQYYKVKEDGTLKAHIIWEDGTEETIIKEFRIEKED